MKILKTIIFLTIIKLAYFQRDPCYITDWSNLKRYYIKKGSFMHNQTYSFTYTPKTKEPGDHKKIFTIQICKSTLKVPDISKRRTFSWTLKTEKSDDNLWQAGQIKHMFGNMTLDYTSPMETPNFFYIIPTVVSKSELEKQSGRADFNLPNPDYANFYLYTNELDQRELYIQDGMTKKVIFICIALLILGMGLIFKLKQKIILQISPLKWLINGIFIAWVINFYLLLTFPENNTKSMYILGVTPVVLGLIFSLSEVVSDICFYAVFILSLLDSLLYLSFTNYMINYPYFFGVLIIICKRMKKFKSRDNDLINEWLLSWIISIQVSIYICQIFYFNTTIGGLLQISQGVYLNDIKVIFYFLLFVTLNLFLAFARMKIILKREKIDLSKDQIEFIATLKGDIEEGLGSGLLHEAEIVST